MNPFNIVKGDVVSITGSGGKTTLMYSLANILCKSGSVLIATTTKILKPKSESYIFFYPEEIESISPQDNFIHIYIPKEIAKDSIIKIDSISDSDLNILKNRFDYILLEADGTNGKSLKGWNENEPCISNISTKVISVFDIQAFNKKISIDTVHRLNLFTGQFKNIINDKISKENIINYLKSAPLFKNFNNMENRYLFFNKIKSLNDFKIFNNLANELYLDFNIYFGEAMNSSFYKYKTVSSIILASGFSKRFNGDKLSTILENNLSILEKTILNITSLNFYKIFLVGKNTFSKDLAEKYNLKYLENSLAHLGQSESIKIGVRNSNTDAYMFFLGDMPFLKEDTILKLLYEFQIRNIPTISKIKLATLPPIIFPKAFRENLLLLEGDEGAKKILKKIDFHPVFFYNSKEFYDIDTKEELKKYIKIKHGGIL